MQNNPLLIWPWWVRVSHWLVAAGVFALWLMSYLWLETGIWHRGLGYALTAVVGARIVAGRWTTHSAARLHFPVWQEIRTHLAQIRMGKVERQRGHNPLGQYAVYLIWSLLALLALSGWLSRTDAFWGEDWPVTLHATLSWVLMAVIALHLFAVWLIGRLSGQNLILQMLNGRESTSK